jgi:hypothetical protein
VTDHPPATAPPADDGMMPSSRLAALAVDRDERMARHYAMVSYSGMVEP